MNFKPVEQNSKPIQHRVSSLLEALQRKCKCGLHTSDNSNVYKAFKSENKNLHQQSNCLNATFLAAQDNQSVTTPLILNAARHKFKKLDRPANTDLLNHGSLAENLSRSITLSGLTTSHIQLTDTQPKQLGQRIEQSIYGGIGDE